MVARADLRAASERDGVHSTRAAERALRHDPGGLLGGSTPVPRATPAGAVRGNADDAVLGVLRVLAHVAAEAPRTVSPSEPSTVHERAADGAEVCVGALQRVSESRR